jgi:hypothetical protein
MTDTYYLIQKHSITNAEPFKINENYYEKYKSITSSGKFPVVKILTNHTPDAINLFIENKNYKILHLAPNNIKESFLKYKIMATFYEKGIRSFIGKRTEERKSYINTIEISTKEIQEYLNFYKKHLDYKNISDYLFNSADIIKDPNKNLLDIINLPYISLADMQYVTPDFLDRELLKRPEKFDEDWQMCYKQFIKE